MCVCVCVCVREREVTGRHSTETQKVLYLCIAKAGRYIRKPTSSASKGASSRLKGALLQSVVQTMDCEVGFTHGGLETVKEVESGIEIVHGWFTERARRFYFKHLLPRAVMSVAT